MKEETNNNVKGAPYDSSHSLLANKVAMAPHEEKQSTQEEKEHSCLSGMHSEGKVEQSESP